MARGLHTISRRRRMSSKQMSVKRASFNAALGLLMFSAAVVSGVASTASSHAAAASGAVPSASTPAPPCPGGYRCVTLPCTTGSCPTVEAGPTSDLGTNPAQYAFVKLYNFPAGDSPEIALCTDTAPLSSSAPLCSTGPPPLYAPIFADGTGSITYQVIEAEKGPGQNPISGEILGNNAQKGTFYCDDAPDLCSLVVFDQNLDGSSTPDASNTAVIPVTYAVNTGGCSSATLVNTASDFGIEGLVGAANQSGCTGSSKAIAFNTALNSYSAVNGLSTGSVQIAFTDDPEAPDEQALLHSSTSHYAVIPVAASADVLGFSADIQGFPPGNHTTLYPQTTFELTPNMVAGMATTVYNGVTNADLLTGVKCMNPGIPPPKKIDPCPAEEVLNSTPSFQPQESYATYVRSDNAGVTDELLHWLCTAPDHTVPINGTNASETDTAAQILESTKWSQPSLDGTCPETDQFPGLVLPAVLRADENPQNQAKALYQQVSPSAVPPRQAGFAVMNWYEALYYGLNSAALQNAAGQFVTPSAPSIDAALNDASANPDGTLSFNYANTADAAAYAEPVVFYAAVSTAPQVAAQANATKRVLDNILALTGSPGSPSLPAGIVALPASLTRQAQADIAKDIVALPPVKKPGKGSGSGGGSTHHPGGGSQSASGGSSTQSGGSGSAGISGSGGSSLSISKTGSSVVAHTTSSDGNGGQTAKGKTPSPAPSKGGVFRAIQVALAAPEWRWLLGGMLIVGAIAVAAGPLLLLLRRLRRRLLALRGRT